jgi:rsbT co-antagonist protein RsbR
MTTTSDSETTSIVGDFLDRREQELIGQWRRAPFFRLLAQDSDQRDRDCAEVLTGLRQAIAAGEADNPAAEGFSDLRALLTALVAQHGRDDSGAETAAAMNALKEPLLRLWRGDAPSAGARADGALLLAGAVDTLRLVLLDTTLAMVKETVATQREQLTELATPVIKLWEGVLAIPLIGTLDSMRSQVATESLLQAILTHQARVAILDITGVETVDTMVAQHLLKTAQAARLMGAECVISGIRPQIATTMVQLGIDLDEVATKARLADAFEYALGLLGLSVAATGPR